MRATCSEPKCGRPVAGRGLCGTHYAYRRNHGTLPPLTRTTTISCTVEGCDLPHDARGLCRKHYQRLGRTGSIAQPLSRGPHDERFWAKVDQSGGPHACWPWLAGISYPSGYGNIWWNGFTRSAHRIAYELAVGEIPSGLTLDHLCRVRHCVNPAHLEAVPFAVNNARGTSPSAANMAKTHCKHGHEFTPENTYRPPKKPTSRHCRRCATIRTSNHADARRRAATATASRD
jgi:hypothetical protein